MSYPATFGDLIQEVKAELRLETADESRIGDWINRAYARGAIETEAVETADVATLAAGESTYTLPAPVVRIKLLKIAPAAQPTSYGPPLVSVSLSEINRLQAGDAPGQTGAATVFTVVGEDQIILWPTPAAADQLLFWYVKVPVPLSSLTGTLELQEPYGTDIAKYGACAEGAALAFGSPSTDYRGLYQQAVMAYRAQLSRRRAAAPQQFAITGGMLGPTSHDTERMS